MSACPVCGKQVDALRAPAAKIKGGKVVAYCSKEHADRDESQPVSIPRAASQPAAAPAPAAAATAKAKKRTPPAGSAVVPKTVQDLDSGPVIEIVHEPSSGVVASAPDARSNAAVAASHAEADGAIEIADTGHVDDYVGLDPPRSHLGRTLLLIVLLLAAGGAFAAYRMGYFAPSSAPATAPHTIEPAPPPKPEPPPAVTPPTPADALARAQAVLGKQLASATPRVQRLAASALARTGDAAALAALTAAIAKESSELAKLEMDYALARGGDKRGSEALVAALSGGHTRDVRAEAARRLALLGDKRAVPVLSEYLDVSQLRLGAAEQLAYVAEPKALDVLDKLRKDDKASADDRARATIALGIAGKTDVADALHELLASAAWSAVAADALAALHDKAARPVLEQQLQRASLRVRAARGLRRLDPKLDPAPLLAPLVAALDSAKDVEQVEAAEAILLLVGPPGWSERE